MDYYENCQYFMREDECWRQNDMLDHPSYTFYCIKSGVKKELAIPDVQCGRCKINRETGHEEIAEILLNPQYCTEEGVFVPLKKAGCPVRWMTEEEINKKAILTIYTDVDDNVEGE